MSGRPDRRVVLPNGEELRVVKVSLGTNHSFCPQPWKNRVSKVLPPSLNRFVGSSPVHKISSRVESLVVWVEQVDPHSGRLSTSQPNELRTLLNDGTWAAGRLRRGPMGRHGFEFTSFDRAARVLPMRFGRSQYNVPFAVENPRPSPPATWVARPLPQTSEIHRTAITLRRLHVGSSRKDSDGLLRFRALGEGRVGWVHWSYTVVEPSGNWIETRWSRSLIQWPRPVDGPRKLVVDAQEYLSLGQIPWPSNQLATVGTVSQRARELGLRAAFVVGPGEYRFADGLVGSNAAVSFTTNVVSTLAFLPPPAETQWVLRLTTPKPGVLCVAQDGPASFEGRIRERIGADGGATFRFMRSARAEQRRGQRRLVADFFEVRLPAGAQQLEAEAIVNHPPVEFFVRFEASPPE